jgi:hypothetical protein
VGEPQPEAQRYDVMLSAKMRAGGSTSAVCVRNISATGIMIQCAVPPPAGTQVQVMMPRLLVTGKVVWADARRFGLAANARIDVEVFLKGREAQPEVASPPLPGSPARRRPDTGRLQTRSHDRHERSRRLGQAMERGTIAAFGIIAVLLIGSAVHHQLSHMTADALAALQGAR